MTAVDPPTDDDLFSYAWGVFAVVLLGLLGMAAVGVYKACLNATSRPEDDVLAEGRI